MRVEAFCAEPQLFLGSGNPLTLHFSGNSQELPSLFVSSPACTLRRILVPLLSLTFATFLISSLDSWMSASLLLYLLMGQSISLLFACCQASFVHTARACGAWVYFLAFRHTLGWCLWRSLRLFLCTCGCCDGEEECLFHVCAFLSAPSRCPIRFFSGIVEALPNCAQ